MAERFFALRPNGSPSLPRKALLARDLLYLKSVLIMKYGKFHTLSGAVKERVGSVRKLKTR